ncbi:MAG: hypothetical protein ABSH45_16090 [Bryobacteraceae bacterium]|jgi:hypothetical protein
MKTLVLVIAACLPTLARERAPDPAPIPAVPHALCAVVANRPAKKPRKWHSPLYYLRRAGQAEVNLAIRLSSWGIHDNGTGLLDCPVLTAGSCSLKPFDWTASSTPSTFIW